MLRFETFFMKAASLGNESPLADLKWEGDLHSTLEVDQGSVSEEEARHMGRGRVRGILPYTLQDGYGRKKRERAFKAAVLENEALKAVFLPELGGRLWSLYDKKEGRELLHRNPVFQPCNLGLRNAWFSGGVEWNVGIIGHTPFTASPLYCESLSLKDGTPVLRLYQYERVRRVLYRVEACLPDHSPYLFVRVRLDNAVNEDSHIYWWSNIAVDEREDVRVLVPAKEAFYYGYEKKLSKLSIPLVKGMDISRSTEIPQAMDFFFDVKKGTRPFIAAVGGDGRGFVQSSTGELMGRKLFVWGQGAGGAHWQSFLSEPQSRYLEIQAGLAKTQLEHLPFAPGESLSWLEAYGPLKLDPEKSHGENWDEAVREAGDVLEKALPQEDLKAFHERMKAEIDGKTGQLISLGDGWAALEELLLGPAFQPRGLRFPMRALKKAEREWLTLLQTGVLPCPSAHHIPLGYQVSAPWRQKLEESLQKPNGRHWYSLYHLSVMAAYLGETEQAKALLRESLALARSPYALRNLAWILLKEGDYEGASEAVLEATGLLKERQLLLDALKLLNAAKHFKESAELYLDLPYPVKTLGRARALNAEALIALNRLEEAEALLMKPTCIPDDIREGELSLSELWFKLQYAKRFGSCGERPDPLQMDSIRRELPPPSHLDFRMKV